LALLVAARVGHLAADTIEVQSVLINVLHEAKVPARQEGVVESILVEEGQMVSKGDVLAQIEDEQARLSVERARTEAEIAKKQSENLFDLRTAELAHSVAANDLRRANESKAKFERSVSPADLDRCQWENDRTAIAVERSKFDMEIAKLMHKVRENELSTASSKLEEHKIVAPLAGMVVEIKLRPGEWVKPGEQVLRILQVDRLRADGFVKADEVRGTLKGATVTLTVDRPGGGKVNSTGEVIFVSPEISPVDRKVRIWAAIENPDFLLQPGMNARMSIKTR
jgi:multidrug efflux pump subunit AcrA (membrane-fusion protein)